MDNLFIIMGVSGCGKSTISFALAKRMGWLAIEADDFHSSGNIAKMSNGVALCDEDRKPWIDAICLFVNQADSHGPVILACSALTPMVQAWLLEGMDRRITWVWLEGSPELIGGRIAARRGHFMPKALIKSQFDALSIPSGAIKINIDHPIPKVVTAIEDAITP